jgi:hypothetical protein
VLLIISSLVLVIEIALLIKLFVRRVRQSGLKLSEHSDDPMRYQNMD